ncbi:UNVERIFIED_CONTAM: Cyclic nucleotide-gated ion channel 1 [Sesamum latifolium]|uniref:Cyclic nucleotide-gated ion channel 1 n=1 Tax=Sesamum latifolium TaxID=2727402 RepID=A0AAW2U585_9LAMI
MAIERKKICWQTACLDHNGCNRGDLYCGAGRGDTSFLNSSCQLLETNEIKSPADFDFGIFLDALRPHVAEHTDFSRKFFYCFWWGWRNLSSLGQNLNTSSDVLEIMFSLEISIYGVILVSMFIGSGLQKYIRSRTGRLEEMTVKRGEIEQWMSHRMLPENLRARIRRHEQYKWQEKRGVEEESLISNFPKDLRRDIKRHLCWTLLTRVPLFEKMDEQLLDAMCSRLKPVLYAENSFIFREGDPIDEMLFIMKVWRRHYRRKIEKTLQEAEDRLQNALAKEGSGSSPSLAATIYASRFATNMLRNLRRNQPHNTISLPNLPPLGPLLRQKPAEPDFSAENPS